MSGKRGGAAPDLVGQVFFRLTVLRRAESPDQRSRWMCRCSCGADKIVRGSALVSGMTRSCGCLRGENFSAVTRRARGPGTPTIDAEHRKSAGRNSTRTAKARATLESIFGRREQDTVHVDRRGARLVRGRAY